MSFTSYFSLFHVKYISLCSKQKNALNICAVLKMSSSRDPLIEQCARPEALLSDSQRQKYFSEFFQLFFYRRRIVWFNNASEIFMRHGETHRARACLTSNKLSDNFIVSEGLIDQIRSLSASADSQRYTRGNQLIELKIKPRMSLFHGLLRES